MLCTLSISRNTHTHTHIHTVLAECRAGGTYSDYCCKDYTIDIVSGITRIRYAVRGL